MWERSRLRRSPSSTPRSASPSFSAEMQLEGPQSKRDRPSDVSSRYAPTVRAAPAWNRSMGSLCNGLLGGVRGGGDECCGQVGDQIVDRLDPDREANQVPRRREWRV